MFQAVCTSYQRKECDKELSFHRFPSDQKVCREWIVKIRRDVGPYFQVREYMHTLHTFINLASASFPSYTFYAVIKLMLTKLILP